MIFRRSLLRWVAGFAAEPAEEITAPVQNPREAEPQPVAGKAERRQPVSARSGNYAAELNAVGPCDAKVHPLIQLCYSAACICLARLLVGFGFTVLWNVSFKSSALATFNVVESVGLPPALKLL